MFFPRENQVIDGFPWIHPDLQQGHHGRMAGTKHRSLLTDELRRTHGSGQPGSRPSVQGGRVRWFCGSADPPV